tara:strand:+ start:2997 stop:3527 length:531 start_codon:yes stop_codon:yes gene_type:complete
MGKRSDFERVELDFYPTPYEAVVPLMPHITDHILFRRFVEPCAGNGALVDHLTANDMYCSAAFDINPKRDDIEKGDALKVSGCLGSMFITNPPWDFKILDPMITNLSGIAKTWMLLNADVAHNQRMAPHIRRCAKFVSVGRISWMENGKKGFENCAWFLFDSDFKGNTEFFGREGK